MTNEEIQQIALANGFKLKEQPDGAMALNPYVFDFARTLISEASWRELAAKGRAGFAAAPTPPEGYEDPDSGQWVSGKQVKESRAMNNAGDTRPWFDPVTTRNAAAPPPPAREVIELPRTPSAHWRINGEPDPHDTQYECERAALCLGTLTDDELDKVGKLK